MRLSCLTDPVLEVVADASTAINLVATGCAAAILTALPTRPSSPRWWWTRRRPLDRTARRCGDCRASRRLFDLHRSAFRGPGADSKSLVIGRGADTLDDGEAATIAYAVEAGGVALIDERKAIRICAERYSAIRLGCTVDLFAHAAVQAALGHESGVAAAVFAALEHSRMRVLPRRASGLGRRPDRPGAGGGMSEPSPEGTERGQDCCKQIRRLNVGIGMF